ncbi:hypothetical protein GCM10010415_43510 [Streptomyces atrovirens]|uniref:SpoIIE family protein phosphatase n=1 Tax=Streptomyces atrovirens TaxID=285556 RepID=A0ABW0DVL2_9ACTN
MVGHGLTAAAMAQIRNMLRALLYDRRTPPSLVLHRLDHTLHTITETPGHHRLPGPPRTGRDGWRLLWSTAGHLPPLVRPLLVGSRIQLSPVLGRSGAGGDCVWLLEGARFAGELDGLLPLGVPRGAVVFS